VLRLAFHAEKLFFAVSSAWIARNVVIAPNGAALVVVKVAIILILGSG
jgi:hypothetical protein